MLGNGKIADLPATTVRKKTGEDEIPGETVFALNFAGGGPGSKEQFAIYDLQRTSTNRGAIYRLFDVGVPTNAPLQAIIKTNWNQTYLAKQAGATQARVIAYQLTQASNGLPSFQTEVAKRYLNGDGLEKNMTLARHWLNSACTNRDSQASNLLLRLPSPVKMAAASAPASGWWRATGSRHLARSNST